MSELRPDQVEDMLRISAMCKRIVVLADPKTLDTSIPSDIRQVLRPLILEAKHVRAHLRAHGYVRDERWPTPTRSCTSGGPCTTARRTASQTRTAGS